MAKALALALVLAQALAPAGWAGTLAATRTIRSRAVIARSDVQVLDKTIPGTLSDPSEAVGLEARIVLYAGRPIRPEDVGPPAVIERNQIVPLVFAQGRLQISAEGRALDRAGVGDTVRVMNLGSRSTVTGRVDENGLVTVGATP